jgi:hypothetical protein
VWGDGRWEEEETDFLGVASPVKLYSLSRASTSTIWFK